MAMASLTASLLARKGQARPSAGIHFEPTPQQTARPAAGTGASPVRLTLERTPERAAPRPEPVAEKRPVLVKAEPAKPVSKTLRVDRETHIKLRLLAAGRGVTQQSLMHEAVEALLAAEEGKGGCLCGAVKK
ncbi:hypothetical protein [Gimibacter soli]|uniref:Uncharacterized protein n=1 Tax=Gimibacter soli TaxID=3024400 RepID=A0AAE9XTS0_9PROT|nr:hypothetical protein [Gimibacter soli]WCL54711.1 hypothetical protein PH603_02920 [Gimibacter soli]